MLTSWWRWRRSEGIIGHAPILRAARQGSAEEVKERMKEVELKEKNNATLSKIEVRKEGGGAKKDRNKQEKKSLLL